MVSLPKSLSNMPLLNLYGVMNKLVIEDNEENFRSRVAGSSIFTGSTPHKQTIFASAWPEEHYKCTFGCWWNSGYIAWRFASMSPFFVFMYILIISWIKFWTLSYPGEFSPLNFHRISIFQWNLRSFISSDFIRRRHFRHLLSKYDLKIAHWSYK